MFQHTECEQLKILERSNLQREQRIKRVRQKNFRKKEAELSEELSKLTSESLRKRAELEGARRQFVNEMSRQVFPIEVESLSERDDGEGVCVCVCVCQGSRYMYVRAYYVYSALCVLLCVRLYVLCYIYVYT